MKNILISGINFLREKIDGYGLSGDFPSWHSALQKCESYDAPDILEQVKNATLKVKNGEAVYERDSVLFDTIEYSWPLLASLMYVSARQKGTLKVLDFGGSLGSSFFQNRQYLSALNIEWNVVEQSNFVKAGREYIQDKTLQFFYSIEECIQHRGLPDILITSCTLPYIENPYSILAEFAKHGIPYLLIDNTPFNNGDTDRLCIQKIPASIYKISTLPCWLLSYEKVKNEIKGRYKIFTEHKNDSFINVDNHKKQYQGFLAQLSL